MIDFFDEMLLNFNMKKFLIPLVCFLFIFTLFFPMNVCIADDSAKFEICANSANVYQNCSFSSTVVATLKNKTEISLETDAQTPKVYESDGFCFYKITTPSLEGFVLSEFVALKDEPLSNIPTFNAKTSRDCIILEKTENGFEKTNISLQKGTKVFLYEGYEEDSVVAISYVFENEVRFGYLQSNDVNPNGINPIIITCICLIVALISIIFALVFMKRKKLKLKKMA